MNEDTVGLTSNQIISLIDKARQEDQSQCDNVSFRKFALQEVKLDTIRQRKQILKGDPSYTDFPWEIRENFQDSWIKFVQDNYDKVKIPPSAMRENSNWFELIPNEQEPEKTRYNFGNKSDFVSHIRWVFSNYQNQSRQFEDWKVLTDEYLKLSFLVSSEEMQKQFHSLNRIKSKNFIHNMRPPFNFFSMLKKLFLFIFNVIRRNSIIVLFNMFN